MRAKFLLVSLSVIGLLFLAAPAGLCQNNDNSQLVQQPIEPRSNAGDSVYICMSNGAYVYHSYSSCRGLEKCSHSVKRVSVTQAQQTYGRRPCGYCY